MGKTRLQTIATGREKFRTLIFSQMDVTKGKILKTVLLKEGERKNLKGTAKQRQRVGDRPKIFYEASETRRLKEPLIHLKGKQHASKGTERAHWPESVRESPVFDAQKLDANWRLKSS